MATKATLQIDDKKFELPVIEGTEGERAVDIGALRGQTGFVTLDHGFANTGSCLSSITFLNGEKGILRHRGYSIEELAENSTFLELAYLLIYGELPKKKEHDDFVGEVTKHTLIHENLRHFFEGFPLVAHPMAILSSMVCSLSVFYQDQYNALDPEHADLTIRRLLAKIPTIAAFAYKKSIGQPFVYPDNSLDYSANLLNMLFAVPAEPYEVDPEQAAAINLLLILHADHEQNCSTSTVRLVGSSQANLFASISAGIAALWGRLHGGANQAVLEMLAEIHRSGAPVSSFVEKAKDKDSPFRLMGFGHRVYKNFDPRAKIIKKSADQVLALVGVNDPLLQIARELEEAALKDDYFVERKLYPNVDFYSGIIYRALGIPVNMFTVMFAIGRLPGWMAHWLEMTRSPNFRIGRPRQVYTGATQRDYVAIDQR